MVLSKTQGVSSSQQEGLELFQPVRFQLAPYERAFFSIGPDALREGILLPGGYAPAPNWGSLIRPYRAGYTFTVVPVNAFGINFYGDFTQKGNAVVTLYNEDGSPMLKAINSFEKGSIEFNAIDYSTPLSDSSRYPGSEHGDILQYFDGDGPDLITLSIESKQNPISFQGHFSLRHINNERRIPIGAIEEGSFLIQPERVLSTVPEPKYYTFAVSIFTCFVLLISAKTKKARNLSSVLFVNSVDK